MQRWQRPPIGPVPWRQAVADRLRRIEPRSVAKRTLVVVLALLFVQLGWQWRSTTIRLGQRQTLVVMTRSVPAGQPITAADIHATPWPSGLAPEGAVAELPADAIAAADLVAGEVLVTQRLFPTANGLRSGQRLVTIPQPLASPPVDRGTSVELFGLLPIGDGLTSPATRITSGTVVVVTDAAISIAVDRAAVPTIVEHLAFGSVEVIVGP